jgi:hypothetical protein
MKFLIQIILVIVICFLLQSLLPWWSMAIGSFCIGYLTANKGYVSFAAGFIGVALLWFGMAFYLDATTNSILTEKVNKLLPFNSFLLTAIIGGLVSGFASLTGALLKSK